MTEGKKAFVWTITGMAASVLLGFASHLVANDDKSFANAKNADERLTRIETLLDENSRRIDANAKAIGDLVRANQDLTNNVTRLLTIADLKNK